MWEENSPLKKVNWVLLTLTVFGLINVAGLISIHARLGSMTKTNPPPSPTSSPNTNPPESSNPVSDSSDISALRDEIVQLRAEQKRLQQVLGSSEPDSLSDVLPSQQEPSVTITDSKFQSIEVFQLPLASSKIVGTLTFGKTYPFTTKQEGWYQVNLPDGIYGWVNAQLVKEL